MEETVAYCVGFSDGFNSTVKQSIESRALRLACEYLAENAHIYPCEEYFRKNICIAKGEMGCDGDASCWERYFLKIVRSEMD